MARHSGHRVGHIQVIFAGVVAGALSCGGGGPAPAGAEREQATVSALTAPRTASGEQARATAYADRVAKYRRLAAENRQALTALGASAPAAITGERQAAAALADQLAAAAQKAADFHTQRAAALAATTAAGTVSP